MITGFANGEADVNLSATGLGVVRYRDVRIVGFALACELSLAAAWQAMLRTLISVKLAHLDSTGWMRCAA